MYTKILNVQIIVSLLKQHGIRHLVLSAGTRHVPLAHSVENDDFFICHSVVDERSAAYFAMGLSKELDEPVAIACTSSTATCNYVPAIAEAYFQHVPLLVLTGDRDPYHLGQLEDQMINQVDMYKNFCKKCVNLPVVQNEKDTWYCQRLVNEAILELTRNGKGPVQINFPINQSIEDIADASIPELPVYNKIERVDMVSEEPAWEAVSEKLAAAERILVICGSNEPASDKMKAAVEHFFSKYNAVFATEYLSNLDCGGVVNAYLAAESITAAVLRDIHPDIVIFFGGNYLSRLKILVRNIKDICESWCINDDGSIVDQFQNLTKVFQCTPVHFFEKLAGLSKGSNNLLIYNELMTLSENVKLTGMDELTEQVNKYTVGDAKFKNLPAPTERELLGKNDVTAFSAMKGLAARIQENSLLHLSILNSTRIMQMFPLKKGICTYSNIGTDGIDGSMSTFFGQASARNTDCYLVIGDLSFFYDMNSVGIREVGNNVHILLINNGGGAEFYFSMGPERLPNIDMHISAGHSKRAKEWVEANNFLYLSATTREEYDKQIDTFCRSDLGRPVIMEVFTDKVKDIKMLKGFRRSIQQGKVDRNIAYSAARHVGNLPGVRQFAETKLGQSVKEKIKKLF